MRVGIFSSFVVISILAAAPLQSCSLHENSSEASVNRAQPSSNQRYGMDQTPRAASECVPLGRWIRFPFEFTDDTIAMIW
jgi:hypothetical protein